jgi:hypothetical protein
MYEVERQKVVNLVQSVLDHSIGKAEQEDYHSSLEWTR